MVRFLLLPGHGPRRPGCSRRVHARHPMLPAGVERIYPAHPDELTGQVILHAVERNRDGDTYTYDLDVCTEDGRILERWEGLRLQAVRKTDGRGPWIPALLGPFLERQAA